jgi:tetratricopeptide (TPR) repeat protein
MTRDNLLFATIGVLAGFISGYFVHEVMAVRQPPPLAVLEAAQAALAGNGSAAPPSQGGEGAMPAADPAAAGGAVASGGGSGAAGGPPMAEITRLKEQVEKNPNDAEAILTLANLNYDIRNWARARELYERYLKLRPAQADVLTDLGVSLRGLGQFRDAMARFEEAQKLQEGHWQSLYNEVVVLAFDLKDIPRAQQVLARLRQLQPDNAEVTRLADEVTRRGGSA